MNNNIILEGIETNNLKDINVELIKKAINLIIGPSGSGKSSLAYNTIGQIGQHEFLAMFADNVSEPTYKVKSFSNMLAAVPIKQSNHNNNVRSTIGTYFGLNRNIGYIYAVVLGLSEDIFVLNKESNLCNTCHGLGTISILDEVKIVDYNKPLNKNPFKCWNKNKDFYEQIIEKYCNDYGINSKKTFKELTNNEKKKILYGKSENKYSIRYKKINSFSRRTTRYFGVMTENPLLVNYSIGRQFYSEKSCPYCEGKKYNKEYEQYKVCNVSIGDFMCTPFSELITIIEKIIIKINDKKFLFTLNILKNFVEKAIELNLGHLFFHRAIPSLSGGELQRLRMVQVFNTQLTDLLVILDEPLGGLSGREKDYVYKNIVELSKKHTIVIVDHSEKFVSVAKKIIALGEEGGNKGGYLVDGETYLKNQRYSQSISLPQVKKEIHVLLKNNVYKYEGVDLKIAENCMNLIIGDSGVGKSTLLREYFIQNFEKYLYINQKPLLGNKNSSVATILDIYKRILELFAKKFSKDKNYFSNLTGNDGMCPICQGGGYIQYGKDKANLTSLECEECQGTGFNKNLKKYKIKEKNIFDIWKMTISESIEYFEKYDDKIVEVLIRAQNIMLGHLKIGQPTSTLSGGENIRIKALKAFKTSANIIGIDEPFKGLNQQEIFKMIKYLELIRSAGKTIIVIDHTEDIDDYFSKKIILKNRKNWLVGI